MLKQTLSTSRISKNIQTNLKVSTPVVSAVVKNASKVLSRVDINLSFSTMEELLGVLDSLPGISKNEKSSAKFQESYQVGIVLGSKDEISQVESIAEILHRFGVTYKISIVPDKKFTAYTKYAKENKFKVIICTSQQSNSVLPIVRISETSSAVNSALNAINILAITDSAIKNRLNLLSKEKTAIF